MEQSSQQVLDAEYQNLCRLIASLCTKTEKFSTEWKIFSKTLKTETSIKVEGEIAFIWDDGVTGKVGVSLTNWRDDNLCRELAQPLLEIWQAKIDNILRRIKLWELASGKEFDGFC